MNYMHWHLTEDQGWRIEIKKYPRLTEIGAWRNGTVIGHFPGTASDNTRSGGFYTQEDIKEVIAYARKRYITIIPEIEMPGHGSAAIAAYPWLSCFENTPTKLSPNAADLSKQQGGKQVQETWGVFEDVFCAGNDSTFTFLQNVIDEVAALFPSPYIHVGGDECPKTNWKKCPKCQARMQQLGLKTEHELQSYFVQRMEKYVNAKGKKLIGWDEILEGGLAPNATVMSWRGEKGGIEAAKQNHDVIMTPTTYVYFDYAQTKKEDSLVIGGFLPIEKVYGYDPIPEVLPASQAKYILGAQANVWTEYIGNSRKMEYVIFPRMSALSEVLWSPKAKKNFDNFRKKLQTQIERFNLWKVDYSKAIYDLHASILPTKNYKGVLWKLESNLQLRNDCNTNIGITDQPYTDALTANKERISIANAQAYKGPILVQVSKSLKAVLSASCSGSASKDWDNITQDFFINKASGKKITLAQAPASNWSGNGAAFGLVNGVISENGINSSEWLGWQGKDMEATIDLGAITSISSINCHILDRKESWIYPPLYIEAFTSNDGIKYQPAGKTNQFIATKDGMQNASINLSNSKARYAKIIARNFGSIPDGHEGAGNPAWFFADEIQIN
jgi:hexosaminidase